MWIWIIFGAAFSVAILALVLWLRKNNVSVTWYEWLIGIVGVLLLAFTIQNTWGSLYELEPRLVEADYGAACRFLSLKNRRRSLICLMTDVIGREASAVIISYMARFARYHLPLAVTLTDPAVRSVAEEPLARRADAYCKAAALDVLAAREEALTAMRHQGVAVLEADPRALIGELINRYLLIKYTRRL